MESSKYEDKITPQEHFHRPWCIGLLLEKSPAGSMGVTESDTTFHFTTEEPTIKKSQG